ncbi:unnamed protein product [Cylicostephanus goldi]|uniref:Uncharacterized protein n=1 Tax=Cylicostephanus goldi TaxID=71465 RepID=A0A3P7QP97_CYLGO|nr:unnamed protein product [Cylicostephanus goldi]
MTTLQPGIRWDPTKYELDDFDFNELTEMFAQLRAGLKKFVMLTMTNYELDTQAKKFLSTELLSVHERFVYRMIQICDLTLLKDRIDAALHVRKVPLTNEIGIHAEYQSSSADAG